MPTSSNDNFAIRIRNLSKSYALKNASGKDDKLMALNNISLDIKQGEAIGIIGPNGSGKSTLLKILSEITAPDSGSVEINGKVASILEVGTGFNPDLSGRKNIYLNARLHGMKKAEVDTKFEQIVDLFGFPNFLDTPVKHYSSGMYMRLAFAVVVHIDADIYLFDEVLSVGDEEFRGRAIMEIEKLKHRAKTIGIITHSTTPIMHFSDKMLLLNNGTKVFYDIPSKTIIAYKKLFSTYDEDRDQIRILDTHQLSAKKNIDHDDKIRFDITSFKIYNDKNEQKKLSAEQDIVLDFDLKYHAASNIILVLLIKDQYETVLVSLFHNLGTAEITVTKHIKITIPKNSLNASEYIFDIFAVDQEYKIIAGYQNLIHSQIKKDKIMDLSKIKGYINLPINIDIDE